MRVLTVCAGPSAPLTVPGRGAGADVASAIVKRPVSTPEDPLTVAISRLGVVGDEQADRTVHGGPSKAVYAYPVEHYPFWETVRMQAGLAGALPHGFLGENLTIEGLVETGAWVGDLLRIGEVELRIESPRQPCFKFDARMGFNWAARMMVQSGFTGFYCSVVREGRLGSGEAIGVVAGDRVVSIGEMHRLKNRSRR